MSLLDTLKSWSRHNAEKYVYQRIPTERVRGARYEDRALQAQQDYLQVVLAEMHLKNDRQWFSTWHPVAHSLVRLDFGGQVVDLPGIAGVSRLPQLEGRVGEGVSLNHNLTSLVPFGGGTVELSAGLLGVQGTNQLQAFLKTLGELSSLLAEPQLSAALRVAGPVASGFQSLFGPSDGGLHLNFHQTFSNIGGGSELRPGYMAVALATEADVDPRRLWVVDDRLRYGDSPEASQPLTGHHHLLLRIDATSERDDYRSLASINGPRLKAREVLARNGFQENDESSHHLRTAVAAALGCPELTAADQLRVAKALKAEAAELLVLGAVPRAADDLDAAVRRHGGSPRDALRAPRPSLADLLTD